MCLREHLSCFVVHYIIMEREAGIFQNITPASQGQRSFYKIRPESRLMRYAELVRKVVLYFCLSLHGLGTVYLWCCNLPIIWRHCPVSGTDVFAVFAFTATTVGFGLVLYKGKWSYLWMAYALMLGFTYDRLELIRRFSSYDLTDEELTYFGAYQDKLYMIGECLIGLKVSVAVFYIFLHLGFGCLTVNAAFKLYRKCCK